MLHSALLILDSAPTLYRNIVQKAGSIKVPYGCIYVFPEKSAVKKKRHVKVFRVQQKYINEIKIHFR